MREVELPVSDASPLTRSFAACLAAVLEVDADEVPCPAEHEPWPWWHGWLAQRGLGLVPVAEPRAFSWPGYWIGVLRREGGVPVRALDDGSTTTAA